jgi:hypothetical protein
MKLTRENRQLGEKPVPVPLCPPQILHGLTRDRTRASAVRGRRLTAWAICCWLKSHSIHAPATPLTSKKHACSASVLLPTWGAWFESRAGHLLHWLRLPRLYWVPANQYRNNSSIRLQPITSKYLPIYHSWLHILPHSLLLYRPPHSPAKNGRLVSNIKICCRDQKGPLLVPIWLTLIHFTFSYPISPLYTILLRLM